MPNYKAHLVGGFVVYGIVVCALSQNCTSLFTAAEWLGCALAGSLFPDIDIKSKGQKLFYSIFLVLFLFLIFAQKYRLLAGASVLSVVPMLVRHRGIFHRLWFVIGAPFALWFLLSVHAPYLANILLFDTVFFVAGAISHLWLDFGFRRMMRF